MWRENIERPLWLVKKRNAIMASHITSLLELIYFPLTSYLDLNDKIDSLLKMLLNNQKLLEKSALTPIYLEIITCDHHKV